MSLKKYLYFTPFILILIFTYSLFGSNLEYITKYEDNINGYNIAEDIKYTQVLENAKVTDSDILQQDTIEVFLQSYKALKEQTHIPDSMDIDLQYTRYLPSGYRYFIILSSSAPIKTKPNSNSSTIATMPKYTKLNLKQTISSVWCMVSWKRSGKTITGYIQSAKGEERLFNFKDMEACVKKLENSVNSSRTAYISNKRNVNGNAPLYNGKEKDRYGMVSYQSAPAYIEPNNNSDFRYLIDGTIVSVIDKTDNYYKIRHLSNNKIYYIPIKYISFKNTLSKLNKVIVVDRKNQNQGTFEIRNGKITLISYTFATTGINAKYKLETPLGYYMVMEKKRMFEYLKDGTKEIDGYAPYAVRFSGGGFIHGVPVTYKKIQNKLVDPGQREYLATIGSTPRSHKCIRNYTSHAKFIYNWVEIGKSAVIVMQ